jgi:hypothetical protein
MVTRHIIITVQEKALVEQLNEMCAESLCPETHDKWEAVKAELIQNRQALKPEYLLSEYTLQQAASKPA